MPNLPHLLDALVPLIREAGEAVMAVYATDFAVDGKADDSPVTEADRRAEGIITAGLRRLAPDIPVIGEEAVAEGTAPRIAADDDARFWLVDPVDGTKEFISRNGEFTVNIALIEHGEAIMGVIYAPATGELYAGEPGKSLAGRCHPQTSQLLEPVKPISARATLPPQLRIVASDFSGRNERTAEFIKTLDGAITHASSSIKFCRIAEGAADLYPRFGDVSQWDAAAGHAILKAAGGDIMLLDGSPLQYGGKHTADFLIHGFVAYANDAAKQAALRAL